LEMTVQANHFTGTIKLVFLTNHLAAKQTRTVLTRRVSSYGLPAWVSSELGPMGGHNLYNVRSSIGTGSLTRDPGEALTR